MGEGLCPAWRHGRGGLWSAPSLSSKQEATVEGLRDLQPSLSQTWYQAHSYYSVSDSSQAFPESKTGRREQKAQAGVKGGEAGWRL